MKKVMECKTCGSTNLTIVLHQSCNDVLNQWGTGEWKRDESLHHVWKPYLVKAICSKCTSEVDWIDYSKLASKFKARLPIGIRERLDPTKSTCSYKID